MTDNLKQRIAEAIGGNTIMHKEQCNEGIYNISVNIDIEKATKEVLDIVEPNETNFAAAIASLGTPDDEFNKWHLDEGELRSFVAKLLPTAPEKE